MTRTATIQVSSPDFDAANPSWPIANLPLLGEEFFYAVKACNNSEAQCSGFSNTASYNYASHGTPQWSTPGGGGLRIEPSQTPGVSIIIEKPSKVTQTIDKPSKVYSTVKDPAYLNLLITQREERKK